MAVRISVKKEKNIPGCGNRWRAWLACVRAESWHADVDPHKEGKEKKILTWVWMMDACVRADVLRADAD